MSLKEFCVLGLLASLGCIIRRSWKSPNRRQIAPKFLNENSIWTRKSIVESEKQLKYTCSSVDADSKNCIMKTNNYDVNHGVFAERCRLFSGQCLTDRAPPLLLLLLYETTVSRSIQLGWGETSIHLTDIINRFVTFLWKFQAIQLHWRNYYYVQCIEENQDALKIKIGRIATHCDVLRRFETFWDVDLQRWRNN